MVCTILIKRERVKGQEIKGKKFLLQTFTEHVPCWEVSGQKDE